MCPPYSLVLNKLLNPEPCTCLSVTKLVLVFRCSCLVLNSNPIQTLWTILKIVFLSLRIVCSGSPKRGWGWTFQNSFKANSLWCNIYFGHLQLNRLSTRACPIQSQIWFRDQYFKYFYIKYHFHKSVKNIFFIWETGESGDMQKWRNK